MKRIINIIKRGMLQNMDKYIAKYSTGSIMGRTVYVSNKNSIKASGISIFGTKVYKDCERHRRWGKYIKKFQK